jgi:hypothetical protein
MSDEHDPDPPTLWGTYYPEGYVVAALPDQEAARLGAAALGEAGWPADEVRVVSGEEALSRRQAYVGGQNALRRLVAALPSAEGEAFKQYVEAAERGEHFVITRAPTAARAEQAASILAPHGAHLIRHYERHMLRHL